MLYIAFCVPQIGVGGPKYFSVPKIGFGVKNDYKAKNEYVFIFNRRGANNNNNNNNNNNGRFPEGVQKEEIQHGGRSAHGQELRRPTTFNFMMWEKKHKKHIWEMQKRSYMFVKKC